MTRILIMRLTARARSSTLADSPPILLAVRRHCLQLLEGALALALGYAPVAVAPDHLLPEAGVVHGRAELPRGDAALAARVAARHREVSSRALADYLGVVNERAARHLMVPALVQRSQQAPR